MIKHMFDIKARVPFKLVDGQPERTGDDVVPISEQSYIFLLEQLELLNACEPGTFKFELHIAQINEELKKYGV